MKKTNKLMLLVVVLLVSVLALTACNGFTPFTVKFETNGGSEIADLKVESLEGFKLPAEPTKEGFTFEGWYLDSALATKFDIEAAKAVDGVVTVYAKWTEDEVVTPAGTMFTVTFMVDGTATEVEVAEGEKIAADKIPTATKEGYLFSYWYAEDYEFGAVEVADEVITADVTFVAEFAKAHKITFVTNIEGVEVEAGYAAFNSKFERPADPTAEGLTFAGWYTEANGEGEYFGFGAWVKEDITVYAKWVYTVTLNYNNGTEETRTLFSSAVEAAGDSATVAIYKVFLNGVTNGDLYIDSFYTLDGEAKKLFASEATEINGDTTVYISWREYITLSFNTGIEGVTVAPVKAEYNAKFEAPTAPEADGLTFAGWYTEANGEGTRFGFGDWAKEDLTVYAKWVYTLTLEHNNGSFSVTDFWSTAVTEEGDDATVALYNYMVEGITFYNYEKARFYTVNAKGEKVDFISSTAATKEVPATVITGDTTVYIEWIIPEEVTLSFNTGIEGLTIADCTVAYNAKFEEPTAPEATGLTFAGWYTEANGEGEQFLFGLWAKYDMTVYAKWVYTATLNYNNGTDESYPLWSTAVETAGDDATVAIYSNYLMGVTKEGCYIDGFYTLDDDGNKVEFKSKLTTITADVDVYIAWAEYITLSFNTGIEGVTVAPVVAEYNAKFEEPTAPEVAGLTFAGWYTEANGEGEHFGFGDWAKEDLTVYAKWVYTATLQYHNGTGDSLEIFSTVVTAAGQNATVSIYNIFLAGIENEGYEMAGLYTEDDGAEIAFVSGKTVITGDVTIWIKWVSETKVTLSFETGVGTTVEPVVAAYNQKFERPTNPTAIGLTFAGWYTEANGEGEQFLFGSWAKEDMTVYAKWVYTATLNYNNDTMGSYDLWSSAVANNGADATVSIYKNYYSHLTFHNYEMDGFYTIVDGEKVAFESGKTVITEDTIIFVNWVIPEEVTLNFVTNIEGVTVAPVKAAYNAKFEEPTAPEATGLTFAGWYTEANGEGEQFLFGSWAKYDMTVYAKWVYTATLNYNNGTNDSYPLWSTAVKAAGDDATVAIYSNYVNGIENPGYIMDGFYTLDGDTKVAFESGKTVITAATTIYINWTYGATLTVDADGTLTKAVMNEGVTELVIPSLYNGIEITAIAGTAIFYVSTIESIVIPSTVTELKTNAIYFNPSLKTIVFEGNGLTTLAGGALGNNAALEAVYLPASIETMGTGVFGTVPANLMIFWGESFADAQRFDIAGAFGISDKIAYGATSINNYVVTFTANPSTTVVDHYEAVPMGKTVAYYAHAINEYYQGKVATWYTDKACTTKFDFETRITADIALYAVFTDTDYTRVFTPTQLKDAFAAGGKIQLINNFTADLVVASGKTVVLDLNGYTITAETEHAITNNGNLTVDGKEIATGETVDFTTAA